MSHAHTHEHGHRDPRTSMELLDLDGEVLHEYWSAALDWVHELAVGTSRTRLLDLGAGTGVGTIGLAQRFSDATITALDIEEPSLARISEKAAALGLADRVHAEHVDLDHGLPDLGPIDLTWASMSLHHFADPERVLRDLLAITRPGGLVAVAEFDEPVRVLPESMTTEQRWLERMREDQRERLPHLGAQWSQRLTDAGFEFVAEREFVLGVSEPSPAAGRYAQLWLTRMSSRIGDHLDADDLAELAGLIADDGPESVRNRTDLAVRGIRTVTVAMRPLV